MFSLLLVAVALLVSSEVFVVVDDATLPEDNASCVGFVRCPPYFDSVLPEDELDTLPLRDEEFVRFPRPVEDKNNLLKSIIERRRIGFLVQVLRTDVERTRIELVERVPKVHVCSFCIAGELYIWSSDAW